MNFSESLPLYGNTTSAYANTPSDRVQHESTMSTLSSAVTQVVDAMLRVEKLADSLAGGVPQPVSGMSGKSAVSPPVASALREHAMSLHELANRLHGACQRIEEAF